METSQSQRYIPLVREIADQVFAESSNVVPLQDLVDSGMEGLATAQQGFQTRHGSTFRTYATYEIRSHMYARIRQLESVSQQTEQLFREKANERMQVYVGSAEASFKRSLSAETAELKAILEELAVVFILCHPEMRTKCEGAVSLSESERSFVEAYFSRRKNLQEVAADFSAAYLVVGRILTNLIKKIQSALKSR